MGFHRSLETDGTPAPGMRWEELDNLARRQVRRLQKHKFNFNQFTSQIGIDINYAGWCDYCKAAELTDDTRSGHVWFTWLDRFLQEEDERDLADTQADCLR